MTISTTTSSVTYQGNGSTTAFTFPFVADSASDIVVTYVDASGNQLVLNPSQYTLVINATPVGGLWGIGGSVTYPVSGTPIQSGTSINISRAVPYTQNVSISNQGAFYPQAVEQGLDILELQIQQINNEKGLAIRVPDADTTATTILPMGPQRVSQLVGFDGTGENVQMYPTSAVPGPIAFLSQTVNHSMSPYTASNANVLFVDASAGSVVINLPVATPITQYFVSRLDNTYGNNVTVVAHAGQTINGVTSFSLLWQYQSNVFLSDNVSSWKVVSQFRKQSTGPVTGGYESFLNIFDVINDSSLITAIQSRVLLIYLDSYIAAAIALGGMIYFPAGDYHFNNTVTMAPGVEFCGAGMGNTVFYTTGNAGAWGFELLNPNGVQRIEAPKFRDIQFQILQNGIRWNSLTGGFTDDGTSQQYMIRPMIERCLLSQDTTPGTGIGIQMNKCFNFWVRGCGFVNFSYPMDFEGSDIGTVLNNRTDGTTVYEVLANSHNTFGSHLNIMQNDFNDPAAANAAGGFVSSSYRSINIENNHMETDTAFTRTNLLWIRGNNAFDTKIQRNQIDNVQAPTNWLRIESADNNKYLVSVSDNVSISSPATMGNVSWNGAQPYFNNSGGRCLIRHGGNGSGEINFPMNSGVVLQSNLASSYAAVVTASSAGINFNTSTKLPGCQNGFIIIPPDANAGHYLEISDWGSLGIIANNLIGTFTIALQSAGDVNGQQLSYQILDGASSVASGTLTHTTANQLYLSTLIASHAFTTKVVIRLWNVDTGNNSNISVVACGVAIG